MDIIDLTPWFSSTKKLKTESNGIAIDPDSAIIDRLRTALCNSGFLFLTGHGIPQSIIDGAFSSARAFFSRPLEEKKRMSSTFFRASRGYSALGSENFATLVGEVCGHLYGTECRPVESYERVSHITKSHTMD